MVRHMMSEYELDQHFSELDDELEREGVDETIEEALRNPQSHKTV